MKKETVRAWGIFYRVRASRHGKWSKWTGPLGVYCLTSIISSELLDILGGRPCLTRTRKQARDIAKAKSIESNKTWTWVQYSVRPVKLTYEALK